MTRAGAISALRHHHIDHRSARSSFRRTALSATVLAGTLSMSSAVAAGGAPDAAPRTLEAVCVARGGSFHVNTYDGVNLICSAPFVRGDFAAERSACDRFGGVFRHVGVVDGRASWFCHDRAD